MPRKSKYTVEFLSPLVQKSTRWSELLRYLGLKIAGGNYRHIKSKTVLLGIDTSHFVKGPWNKGLTEQTDDRVKKTSSKLRLSNEDVSGIYIRNIKAIWTIDFGWLHSSLCYLRVVRVAEQTLETTCGPYKRNKQRP